MKLLYLIGLYLAGLVTFGIALVVLPAPDYMDADYYLVMSRQIFLGKGGFEPFIWNYLGSPTGLPAPAFTYWMPLSALVGSLGMYAARSEELINARFVFLFIAAAIPPLTACLSYELNHKPRHALVAGILGLLSGFYLPYFTVTDSFSLYMLLGGLIFIILLRQKKDYSFKSLIILGSLTGLMHMARADGFLWLIILVGVIGWSLYKQGSQPKQIVLAALLLGTGYILVCLPWYWRNLAVFGSLFPPGNSAALWLTKYDEIFSYPASLLSFDTWIESGLQEILRVRAWALTQNLQSVIAVQGSIILIPFIFLGLWHYRKKLAVQAGILYWLCLFGVMSLLLPFPGVRGSFFHSGSGVQLLLWAMVPAGFDEALSLGVKYRNWQPERARRMFLPTLMGLLMILNVVIFSNHISPQAVSRENPAGHSYLVIDTMIKMKNPKESRPVLVNNPPGYFLKTNHAAIMLPYGDLDTALQAARQFDAGYLILEPDRSTPELEVELGSHPGVDLIFYVGRIRVYQINAHN
jgi:membrane protein CcdC involved in cytochrome C biogenesis